MVAVSNSVTTIAIAESYPSDLRRALHDVAQRLMRQAEQRVPPIGWNGIARELAEFAAVEPSSIGTDAAGFTLLRQRLSLDDVETLIVAAAMSVDVDGRFTSAWQLVGGRIDATRPRFGSVLQLLTPNERDSALRLLQPGHWLRACNLIDILGSSESAFDHVVVANPLFFGVDADAAALGVRSDGLCVSSYTGSSPLVDAQIRRRQKADGAPTAVVIEGPSGSGRSWLAREIAASFEAPTVWVDVDHRAPAQVFAAVRQALVEQAIPCLDLTSMTSGVASSDKPDAGLEQQRWLLTALTKLAELCAGAIVLVCEHRLRLPAPWQTWIVTVTRPNLEQRAELWQTALGERGTPALAADLARRFPLGRGAIFRAHSEGNFRSAGTADPDSLAQAAREQLDASSSAAERIRSSRRMSELIAAPQTISLLQEILSFARYRRTVFAKWGFAQRFRGGLKVLFAGPPGTGKTMSAEIIAAELDLDLFKIDLSNVVSKWIGETEKNLKQVFDQAEAHGGVLLFDEADALFGKRTSNVQSSNDRHSNMEINYLLQRMEAFEGICLLTSNIDNAIDEAFKRRLNFRVQFAKPDVAEREALWRTMIPAQTPIAGKLDFAEVAERFDMAGGNIRNAALRAALLAAADGKSLATSHLLDAAQREFGESGRLSR
jgi:AAA+ superfamily predicted ATPase